MRAIAEQEGLGSVVDPDDPEDLARGLREIIDADPGERAAMRARCHRVALSRYNWETSVAPYLALAAQLADSTGS